MNLNDLYSDVINALTSQNKEWFKEKMEEISTSKNIFETFFSINAIVRRKVGETMLESNKLQIDQAIRILLLLQASKYVGNDFDKFIKEAYSIGDTFEKVAIIKGLNILQDNGFGESDILKEIAQLAKQTSNEDIFCALSLNNPYPAKYFNESEFNTMVLKALHLDLNLEYLMGFKDRNNNALKSLAIDLCKERKSAKRTLPIYIEMVLKANLTKEGWT